MKGREIALATLMQQDVKEPCINYCWMTHSKYLSKAAGRDYWADSENAFYDYLRYAGINLVPQYYLPGEGQRNIELGHMAHEPQSGGWEGVSGPEGVLAAIERLPDDEQVIREFNIEKSAADYARANNDHMARAHDETLFIDWFGQADFMGGYNRWGYENYLMAMLDYPEAMGRYWHHTALQGRLWNQAIALAVAKHGIAPFVYSGQDICSGKGPIASPALLRQWYFPQLKWCIEPLIEAGVGIIWHCDGNIMPILEDILDLGVAGLQGFEEEHGVDYSQMVALNSRAGRPLIILGCVSVTSTFPHGSVEDVRRSVERSFTLAGKGRGFVLSSTSSVMPETPIENIEAFFAHGLSFGREFLA
ncbi:MAG: uroporphyrinogen decarboxylase family protein [Planctomycetaceae bacterium]|nr:hypothetical protein [Planctomycetaceae bacterium]